MRLVAILVPVGALALGVAGGAGGAMLLAPPEEPEDAAPSEEEAAADPAAAPAPVPGEVTEFAEFANQFVVPVVREGRVKSLVLVSITLEVGEGTTAQVFAMEPKLRDAFLQVLFDHANAGGFDDRFTQTDRMSMLRQALRETGLRLLGPVLRDVLIPDIVRQDT